MLVRAVRQALRHSRWLIAVLASIAAMPSAADDLVHFQNPEHHVTLAAYLSRPANDGPAPAVVMLHGCSGLVAKGRPTPLYRDWQEAFLRQGFVVLMVDSASPRGLGQTCTPGEARKRMWAERPSDAYAALAFLQSQPFVDPARVSLGGWSQGGGVVLLSIGRRSSGRPSPMPIHDFARAFALYPGACSEALQSDPFVDAAPNTWTTGIPLLVLMGAADNWTRSAPCEAFLKGAQERGSPIEFRTYRGAAHAFDAPRSPTRSIEAYRQGPWAPVIGTNEEARAGAFDRVRDFLGSTR